MSVVTHFPVGGRSQTRLSRARSQKLPKRNKQIRKLQRIERIDGSFDAFKPHGVPQQEPRLRSLASELGRVREQERKKIADHLHDELGQNLALAKIKLNVLNSEATAKQRHLISGIAALVDQTIKETRSLIQELHVDWLTELEPKEALISLIEQLQSRYDLRCATDFVSLPDALRKDVQEVLLQAVRELVVNAAKHAGVDAVKITCESEKGWIRIRIVDEGRGFGASAALNSSGKGGFGLAIVRARLAQFGGNLFIESRVGTGTRATILLAFA